MSLGTLFIFSHSSHSFRLTPLLSLLLSHSRLVFHASVRSSLTICRVHIPVFFRCAEVHGNVASTMLLLNVQLDPELHHSLVTELESLTAIAAAPKVAPAVTHNVCVSGHFWTECCKWSTVDYRKINFSQVACGIDAEPTIGVSTTMNRVSVLIYP